MDLSRSRFRHAVGQRLPGPVRSLVVDEFNRIVYDQAESTWKTTHWMGVDCRKLPMDLWMLQEIVFETKPDLLIETGVAYGGSTLYYADLFERIGNGRVVAADVDLSIVDAQVRAHRRVELIEGSSTDEAVVETLRDAADGQRVMLDLDSDHTGSHVEHELELLAPLVSEGCYLVVEDTNVNGHPVLHLYGDGPMEALERWLPRHPDFVRDEYRERLLATFNPKGYLRRVSGR